MVAHMSGNQSGAEKDNRLLFGEQWTLLFSKSKMVATNFSQSGAELRTMGAIVIVVVIVIVIVIASSNRRLYER